MLRHRGRALLAVLTAAAAFVVNATPATARNMIGCDYGAPEPCFANNSTHYMSYDLTTGWRSAMESTRTQSYETTDLTTVLSGHTGSDVHFYVESTNKGYYGKYVCSTYGSNYNCNHAHIMFSGPLGSTLGPSELQSVACHETGHSLGLRHPFDIGAADTADPYQCMVVNGFPRYLGAHNADHLNVRY